MMIRRAQFSTLTLVIVIAVACGSEPPTDITAVDESADSRSVPPAAPVPAPEPPPQPEEEPVEVEPCVVRTDLSQQEAIEEYLDALGDAGGGEFADFSEVPRRLFGLLIGELFNTTEVISYSGNTFPAGVELDAMSPEDRAKWRRAGESVLAVLREELDRWAVIEPLLDTCQYEFLRLNELSLLLRAYFALEADTFRDLVTLTERDGPEALATPAAMQRIAMWLWNAERGPAGNEIILYIVDAGMRVDDVLVERVNRAIPNVGMGIGR